MLLALLSSCFYLSPEQLADQVAKATSDTGKPDIGETGDTDTGTDSESGAETGEPDSAETGDTNETGGSDTETGETGTPDTGDTGASDTGETGNGETETGETEDSGETGDADSGGDTGDIEPECDLDGDFAANAICGGDDCDDADPSIYPTATEICNGVDDDCDANIDESAADAPTWYPDLDGDGYGDSTIGKIQCSAPVGYVPDATDCNDSDGDIHPGAAETCDQIDTDCDGYLDGPLGVPSTKTTLQAALDAATDGDTVCVAAGTYAETLDAYDLTVTLQGAGSGSTIVKADGSDRAFTWSDSSRTANLSVTGMTFRGGESAYGAGMYLLGGRATLTDVVVEENACTTAGDCLGTGMYIVADADLVDVTVNKNLAFPNTSADSYMYGVGIYGYDGSMIWANVEVTNNEANAENVSNGSYAIGVGVSLSSVELWGSEVEITRNVSSRGSVGPIYMTGQGAGLAADAGSLVLSDANVSENQFTFSSVNDSAFGGGAYLSDVEADFTRVIFGGNDIGGGTAAGAAMYAYGTFILDFANLLVLDNDASSITSGYGSLALAGAGTASITNADFYQNTVSGGVGAYGGAAYVGPGTTLNLDSTTLMSNSCAGTATPACGGAIYLDGTSSIGSDAYTNYYGNSPGDIGGIVSMNGRTGNFVGNPLYTSGGGTDYSAWDLSVATGSPCINAGNPSILDVDGSRADVGAYGGQSATW